MSERTRTTLLLAALFTAYWMILIPLDSHNTLGQQMALALTTWWLLVFSLRFSPREERIQVITMIVVATCCECFGSLILGAYRYRLENLPLYVPAGHGIFFLIAVRLSELPWLERHRRLTIWSVCVGSFLLVVRSLALQLPDLLGIATWLLFLRFLFFGRRPLLYAVSFSLTMVLEFYGTAHGLWAWAPVIPYLGLTAANPPAGIGAGYCSMDAVARRYASMLQPALTASGVGATQRLHLLLAPRSPDAPAIEV